MLLFFVCKILSRSRKYHTWVNVLCFTPPLPLFMYLYEWLEQSCRQMDRVGPYRPFFTAATFTADCRVNTGVINSFNYGPVPFRWLRLTRMSVSRDALNRTGPWLILSLALALQPQVQLQSLYNSLSRSLLAIISWILILNFLWD